MAVDGVDIGSIDGETVIGVIAGTGGHHRQATAATTPEAAAATTAITAAGVEAVAGIAVRAVRIVRDAIVVAHAATNCCLAVGALSQHQVASQFQARLLALHRTVQRCH